METSQRNSPISPVRALLIEDNEDDVVLLKALLVDSGTPFEIETADSMQKAIQRLAVGGLDIVLCDLKLRDTVGLETFKMLRTAAPKMPVIIVSGLADEDLAMQIMENGAYDYVVKGRIKGPVLARKIHYAIHGPE